MGAHEIPDEVRSELTGYLHLKLMATKEHKEVLEELPTVFRARIFRIVHRPIITKSYLLQGVSDALIDTLSVELKHELYMPARTPAFVLHLATTSLTPTFPSQFPIQFTLAGHGGGRAVPRRP